MKLYSAATVLHFGKYKSKTVAQIFKEDPTYIDFCLRKVTHFYMTDYTVNYLLKSKPNFRFSQAAMESVLDEYEIDEMREREETEEETRHFMRYVDDQRRRRGDLDTFDLLDDY